MRGTVTSPERDEAGSRRPGDACRMITEPAPIEVRSPRLSGRRRALVWALVVLASLIGLGSILTTWVHRQMLDEQAWRQASADLIQNERVRDALSVYLVNELYDNVDVSAVLAQELPTGAARARADGGGCAAPAGDRCRQSPARRATRAGVVRQRELAGAEQAGQRARERHGRRDIDRRRDRDARPRRGRAAARNRPRAARLGARADSAGRRRDHGDAFRSALGGADRRAGRARAQHAAAGARARDVRARDLPGPRRAPGDAAQHRLGVPAGRVDRPRRAPGRRQRRGRRAHPAGLQRTRGTRCG